MADWIGPLIAVGSFGLSIWLPAISAFQSLSGVKRKTYAPSELNGF
jgi:hypothetical protein